MPGPRAFDASTPAEAQTKPCRVCEITSGGRERTTSTASRRITSTCRGSPSSPASSIARADGSTSSRSHDAALDLRDGLLRDDDDVAVLEPARPGRGLGEEPAEVVALLELRQPRERDHADLGSVTSVDAGDPQARVRLVALVDVHDHGGHALERAGARERAGVDRAAGRDLPASSSTSALASASSPQTSVSSSGASSPPRFEAASECRPAIDRAVDHVLDPLGDRRRLGGREDALLREGELGGDREHGRRADRLAQRAGRLDGAVRLRREHDEVGRAGGILVRRPRRRRARRPLPRARSASREPITTS